MFINLIAVLVSLRRHSSLPVLSPPPLTLFLSLKLLKSYCLNFLLGFDSVEGKKVRSFVFFFFFFFMNN
jgi:hypothetical protein